MALEIYYKKLNGAKYTMFLGIQIDGYSDLQEQFTSKFLELLVFANLSNPFYQRKSGRLYTQVLWCLAVKSAALLKVVVLNFKLPVAKL